MVRDDCYFIKIDSIDVKGKSYAKIFDALVDSGNSCFTFPIEILKKILKNNNKDLDCEFNIEDYAPDYATVDCTGKLENFPNINVVINGQNLSLSVEDYVYNCETVDKSGEEYFCETMLEVSYNNEFIILGDGFLQSFYSVYDLENLRIGFARAVKSKKASI